MFRELFTATREEHHSDLVFIIVSSMILHISNAPMYTNLDYRNPRLEQLNEQNVSQFEHAFMCQLENIVGTFRDLYDTPYVIRKDFGKELRSIFVYLHFFDLPIGDMVPLDLINNALSRGSVSFPSSNLGAFLVCSMCIGLFRSFTLLQVLTPPLPPCRNC